MYKIRWRVNYRTQQQYCSRVTGTDAVAQKVFVQRSVATSYNEWSSAVDRTRRGRLLSSNIGAHIFHNPFLMNTHNNGRRPVVAGAFTARETFYTVLAECGLYGISRVVWKKKKTIAYLLENIKTLQIELYTSVVIST